MSRRVSNPTPGLVAVTAAAIAVLVAACSGGQPASTPIAKTPYQQALAYANCMRAHGDPGFPDPNSQGQFPHPAGPQYASATSACSHLLPTQPLTPGEKHQHVLQALKFTACMRTHGYPDFPDPVVQNGGTAVGFGFAGIDTNSPQFHRAWQACRSFEPGLTLPSNP
jgi:hypothetical protein